ncbi:MFS transporter [Fodinicola feengrottensis]|uniref:hypothetical protein n=1 Tax=Fodinicola feengrottensis TaxID=435914 RepID=UPI0024427220|nr:hypothetical protein [Fodinicola feengrottensis]
MTIPRHKTNARRRWALVGLCVTEITSWGVMFYAFPVLSPSITAHTRWPATVVTAAFSVGLVISAFSGIAAGRWLDQHGPRALMTAGSILGVVAMVCVATAPKPGGVHRGLGIGGTGDGRDVLPARVRRGDPLVRPRPGESPDRAHAGRRFRQHRVRAADRRAGLLGRVARQLPCAGRAVLAVVTIPIHVFVLHLPWPAPDHCPAGHAAPGQGGGSDRT